MIMQITRSAKQRIEYSLYSSPSETLTAH